ncbi:MAG: 4-hydroxy-tetrahydrodipicolinate reductase [Bacteroidota bacterium]|nr:4-hydroxy-tetrahydrodipicolinate reductase [Bacteroidota bacterium]MDX5430783.1 4-hydroxy-tetrahydrodipicolinate reductase [Bacteroidota bacterium]MDX5469528.1 4-hydroxy-tetrahydrodipicolinate reductase [Bacteroidota bacterium]
MKIALIGYGKMGQAIENAALSLEHEIVARVSQETGQEEWDKVSEADVAIEFTAPHAAVENIRRCFALNIPVVVGTTGWYDEYEELKSEAEQQAHSLLTATNFSLGVNIFFEINKQLAELMAPHTSYEVRLEEVHHTQKLDAPSGTAITTALQAIARLPWKKTWKLVEDESEEFSPSTLPIVAKRIDEVPGTHTLTYESAIDSIEIKHTAHSRAGFAFGAVAAAEWLRGKTGVFTMENVIKNTLSLD